MKHIVIAACLLLMAACQPVPYKPEYSMPRFDHLPRIPVRAANLQVVQRFQSPNQPPHVEHLMPIAPAAAMEQWIRDRVELTGDNGTVTFTIEDASVIEQPLPRTQGIKGAFTKDQTEMYSANLVITAYLETNLPVATYAEAESKANVKRSIGEDASIQDREQMYYDMMKDITGRIAGAIEPQLRARFNPPVTVR